MFNRKPFLTLARDIAWACVCTLLVLCGGRAYAETPDTITFNDGEQLAGKLISVIGGNVTFHSDILGNVTVPLEKVKTLNTAHPFAVVEKDQRVTRKTAVQQIPVGSIALKNNSLNVSPANAQEKSFPENRVASLVDAHHLPSRDPERVGSPLWVGRLHHPRRQSGGCHQQRPDLHRFRSPYPFHPNHARGCRRRARPRSI